MQITLPYVVLENEAIFHKIWDFDHLLKVNVSLFHPPPKKKGIHLGLISCEKNLYIEGVYNRVGWKSNNRENYPIASKFFCMTQKPSAVCKKSYSQGKTLLRKLKFVIPFFKNNSTWKLWAKFINKDYPTGWVWQTLANTYNKMKILVLHVLGVSQAFEKPKI